MVDGDVNVLEQRHMALTARFKAAWAFHQLLVGMQRMRVFEHFENKSAVFQSLFGRLRDLARGLQGPDVGPEALVPRIAALEAEVEELRDELQERDRSITPSALRQFVGQIRNLDERILIGIVRFYIEPGGRQAWDQDHLDKVDFLVSRLAEKVAGRDLRRDRGRLGKIIEALAAAAGPVEAEAQQLAAWAEKLRDLGSEMRGIRTFDELQRRGLVESYRAFKSELGRRLCHPALLPRVVEVNGAFRGRIDELRELEQRRLLDDYRRLELSREGHAAAEEIRSELARLEDGINHLRRQIKADDIRLDQLAELGARLGELGAIRADAVRPPAEAATVSPVARAPAREPERETAAAGRPPLQPDIDLLQPDWDELIGALSGLAPDLRLREASGDGSVAAFRLEPREVVAFRRRGARGTEEPDLELFVLAAAGARRRVCRVVQELRAATTVGLGGATRRSLREARETCRIADAYAKHFSHLVEQAVFDGRAAEALELQALQVRLLRESTGLLNLLLEHLPRAAEDRESAAADSGEPAPADFRATALGRSGRGPEG